MGFIRRLSPFGIPSSRPEPSVVTTRAVPLTQGLVERGPITNMPPGSATSLCNFYPFNGALQPRSRYSSSATVLPRGGSLTAMYWMQEFSHSASAIDTNLIWTLVGGSASTDNLQALMTSNWSASQASFVSAGGLDTPPDWTLASAPASMVAYPSVFDTSVADDILIFTLPKPIGSEASILAAGLTLNGPIYSYLTDAPKAKYLATFDNYVLAWSILDGSTVQNRRIQWSDRGDPGNWTPGGASVAGFEDLLSMQGIATGIAVQDNRIFLFSTHETWVGLESTYPSQFQFAPLDTSVGCPAGCGGTIVVTELGIVFLGTDLNLRLIPRGGGLSQVINPDIGLRLRERATISTPWAVYESDRRLYHLFPFITGSTEGGLVVNLNTGEYGTLDDNLNLAAGTYSSSRRRLVLGGTSGVWYSSTSQPAGDVFRTGLQSVVTSTWQSAPAGLDLPDGRRQLTRVQFDYKATSAASGAVRVSGDFGNTFAAASSVTMPHAARGGVVTVDVNVDGPGPVIEWTSTQTGYELHRGSANFTLRGRV